jgi:hypothetical protein
MLFLLLATALTALLSYAAFFASVFAAHAIDPRLGDAVGFFSPIVFVGLIMGSVVVVMGAAFGFWGASWDDALRRRVLRQRPE